MARRKNRQIRNTPISGFDWKNHPVVIASGSAAATLLLSIAVFTQLVAPTQNAKLEIELLKLKDAKAEIDQAYLAADRAIEELDQRNKKLTDEVETLKSDILALQQSLIESKAENVFTPGNPYPNGLGLVRIGMDVSEIEKAFAGLEVTRSEDNLDFVAVKLVNSPFDRVGFHLTDESESAKISHISFDMPLINSKFTEDFLFRKMVESFGAPSDESTTRDFKWDVGASHTLYANNKYSYVLMRRGQQPVFWALR